MMLASIMPSVGIIDEVKDNKIFGNKKRIWVKKLRKSCKYQKKCLSLK